MQVFTYRARNARGELISDTISASSLADASRTLRSEGKFVLEISQGVRRVDVAGVEQVRISEAARRVRREEVVEFCHQLSVMLEAGVPLRDALEAFRTQSADGRPFGKVIDFVAEDVQGGSSLSSALSRWPKVFPKLMVSLVEASEASGTMALMLGRVGKYLSKELKTRKQIKGALTYPCVMMMLAVSVTIFLLTTVLPRFASIYSQRSAELPAPTKFMLGVSNMWSSHWPAILTGVVVIFAGIMMGARTFHGRRAIDWLKIHVPVISSMYRKLYLTRAMRTMSTLILSGVDLMETLSAIRGVTVNAYYEEMWDDVQHDLEEGRRLSAAMESRNLIPQNVIQMIVAGEQSGRLGPITERIGEVSEEELDDAVGRVTRFIEPVMIGVMGALVGFVAIALLLPIFSISSQM